MAQRPGRYRAKIFKTGGSQAVRLPRECRLPGKEVWARREGDAVVLEPVRRGWSRAFLEAIRGEPDPILGPREQPASSDRRVDVD